MNLDFSNKEIPFLRVHLIGFILSLVVVVLSFFSFFYSGLNFGIDFKGGTLIEIETEDNVGIAEVRKTLSELSLGDVQIQEFGSKNDILIRVEEQFGGDKAEQNVVVIVKNQLNNNLKSNVTYRRTEVVGPKVSSELIQAGAMAIIVAVFAAPILNSSNYTHFKHGLEWNYFLGVVFFYLLTHFFWRRS